MKQKNYHFLLISCKKILPVDSSPQNSTTRVMLTTRAISFGGQHLKFLNFHGECLGDGWYWSTMIMKKEKQKLAFNFCAMRKYSNKKPKFSAFTLSDSHLILNKTSTESESQLSQNLSRVRISADSPIYLQILNSFGK